MLIGALIGPMQVAGRVMEFAFGRHVKPIAAGTISFAALAAAMGPAVLQGGHFALAVLFALLFGWSNGVLTIVRGTVPAELFGRDDYGALAGPAGAAASHRAGAGARGDRGTLVVDAQRIGTHAALVACGVLALVAYRRAVGKENERK